MIGVIMENIDIIMPVYNNEEYVKKAIESIKKQTNANWNLIIIDDLSTDNSVKEIENSIKDIKEKVIFIRLNQHKGVAETRNIGIRNSKNRYIAFLDSDDKWEKYKLEKQINFMIENNYCFTYTNFSYKKGNRERKVKTFFKNLNYNKALKNTYILTSTVIIDTKQISRENIYMPNIKSEDTATWWQILKKGYVANGLNENLTIYRVSKKSLSANKFKNLKRTWNLYRKQEKFNILKSIYYFINYILNAIKKRII